MTRSQDRPSRPKTCLNGSDGRKPPGMAKRRSVHGTQAFIKHHPNAICAAWAGHPVCGSGYWQTRACCWLPLDDPATRATDALNIVRRSTRENSRAGFHALVERIQTFVPVTQVQILLEATGHYHRALMQYLTSISRFRSTSFMFRSDRRGSSSPISATRSIWPICSTTSLKRASR